MSINSLSSNQPRSLTNPVNAAHFSDIKANIELAIRQKAPQMPGTAQVNSPAVMPGGNAKPTHGPGSVFSAYA